MHIEVSSVFCIFYRVRITLTQSNITLVCFIQSFFFSSVVEFNSYMHVFKQRKCNGVTTNWLTFHCYCSMKLDKVDRNNAIFIATFQWNIKMRNYKIKRPNFYTDHTLSVHLINVLRHLNGKLINLLHWVYSVSWKINNWTQTLCYVKQI